MKPALGGEPLAEILEDFSDSPIVANDDVPNSLGIRSERWKWTGGVLAIGASFALWIAVTAAVASPLGEWLHYLGATGTAATSAGIDAAAAPHLSGAKR